MKILKYIFWGIMILVFLLSFVVITGIFRPQERINAVWLVVCAGCFYIIAYRFYASFLSAKIAVLDDSRVTPAYRLNDGKNYYPTNRWVLFGHHFAAIAGAGPLIGPVLASQFGYLPGFLWILIGAVLAGGTHDFIILVASMRGDGKSLAKIARDEVGRVAGGSAMAAILFILIVAIAGLGLAVVNSLFRNPWGTFIISMTIPIALFMGVYMKSIRPHKVAEVSIIGVTLLLLTLLFGKGVAHSGAGFIFDLDKETVSIALAIYGFVASVLPVWLLLAPRDYLSSFMKIGVIVLLSIGVIIVAPNLHMPPVTKFVHGGGPVIPGKVFPFVFITIACGAISGFHSLISSGTTPKMIEKETYARSIGYGAMLTEGFVAVVALIAATLLIPGDYFAINTKLSLGEIARLGFPAGRIEELCRLVEVDVKGRPGGAVSLAVGMASIFGSIPFLKTAMAYLYQFALMFEALFILTTIDAGTRVARYIVQELGGYIYKPFGDLRSLTGNIVSSAVVVVAWGFFILTGSIDTIWPIFGNANQLLAMLALCIGTTLIIKWGKTKYIWVTLVPMLFMISTTFTAGIVLFRKFTLKVISNPGDIASLVDAIIILAMLLLALIIVIDSFSKWWKWLILKKPVK